jgi:hypothetical protein
MKAVLRVWWTLFTAVALQRVLGVIGSALLALGVIGWLLSGHSASFGIGFLAFAVLAGTPALFAAPVLFRSLSAVRTYQLLPHFRLRMLLAVSLLLGAPLLVAFVFVLATALTTGLSLWAIGYPLAFLVAIFLVLFLAFGDPRWFLIFLVVFPLTDADLSPAAADMLAALPAWLWSATALGAWAVFAAWYLRVRQVRGVVLTPEGSSAVDATRPVLQTVAIRVLLAPNTPRAADHFSLSSAPLLFLGLVVIAFTLTTFVGPLLLMGLFARQSVAIVRQSRLLWLRVPGARDAVRGQIERALWRNLAVGCAILLVAAAIAASPFVGHGAAEIALGLALSAGAAIYASYVALAAVPGMATYFWGLGSMALLQIGLLVVSAVFSEVFSAHSLTAMAVVAAVELAGAALLRALAVRRWRTVDWLRFKPLGSLVGVPRSL